MDDPINFNLTNNFKILNDDECKEFNISKASMLAKAQSLLSNINHDIDILPTIFSIAKVNVFNKNDDAITPLDAAKLLRHFVHKPINVEHETTTIVGHITNASFSDYEPAFHESDPFDFLNRTDAFYICGAGIIYKSAFPRLANALIEASEYDEPSYAASWELLFDYYDISYGNGETISECKIITANDPEFNSLSSHLKFNGGTGMDKNGQKVRRILRGSKTPLGVGLTENPAADVRGIYTLASIMSDEKISETEKTDVTDNKIAMDKELQEELNSIKELISKASVKDDGDGKQALTAAEQIFNRVSDMLKSQSDWKPKAETAEAELQTAKDQLASLAQELKEAKDSISQFQKDIQVRDAAAKFNDRMDSLASIYEFNDDEEKIVAQDVKALSDDDEAFQTYLDKAKVVFAHRNKEFIAEQNKGKEDDKEDEEEKGGKPTELETLESKASTLFLNNNGGTSDRHQNLFDRVRKNGLVLENQEK